MELNEPLGLAFSGTDFTTIMTNKKNRKSHHS